MGRIRSGVGFSLQSDPRAAAEEAAAAVLASAGGRIDAALLFATPDFGEGMSSLLDAAAGALGCDAVVGASAHGVLGAGRECEGKPAVTILGQAGLESRPFLLQDLAGDESVAGEEIAARLGDDPREGDLVVLLPDPRSLHSEPLLEGIRRALGPAQVVGAGAADPVSAVPLQWCGRQVETGALAGMVLRGSRPPRIGVTQACVPIREGLTVTRAAANWIVEIDGRPALDVYREAARGPLAEDLRRAAAFILVALPQGPDSDAPLRPGDYLVRHVVGFDLDRKAFALPEMLRDGQPLALVLREPGAARDDLKAMLANVGGGDANAAQAGVERVPSAKPAFGLYFNCCARGQSLFGIEGLESAYLSNAFEGVAIAGPFGSCEIGPVAGRTELLTYTGVLALIDS